MYPTLHRGNTDLRQAENTFLINFRSLFCVLATLGLYLKEEIWRRAGIAMVWCRVTESCLSPTWKRSRMRKTRRLCVFVVWQKSVIRLKVACKPSEKRVKAALEKTSRTMFENRMGNSTHHNVWPVLILIVRPIRSSERQSVSAGKFPVETIRRTSNPVTSFGDRGTLNSSFWWQGWKT